MRNTGPLHRKNVRDLKLIFNGSEEFEDPASGPLDPRGKLILIIGGFTYIALMATSFGKKTHLLLRFVILAQMNFRIIHVLLKYNY